MRPTQILSDEHRVIEVVLACLDQFVAQSRIAGSVDKEIAGKFIDFVRNFADGCHHNKEEKHLFTMLESKGASREHGPVAVMLYEHVLGRGYIKVMAENLPAAANGDATAVRHFCDNADGYIQLLRLHIAKEDNILFPLADQLLSDADQTTLESSFAHVESHETGEGKHQHYLDLARQLAEHFQIADEPVTKQLSLGGCSCSQSAAVHARLAAQD